LAAAAGDRWIHIRSGPFEIVTDAGDRGGQAAVGVPDPLSVQREQVLPVRQRGS